MDVVMIGVDPHKRSVTIEARDARAQRAFEKAGF